MARSPRSIFLSCLSVVLLGTVGLANSAQAGLSESMIALAGPLAEQFGVPAEVVTGLLENGLSLDSVTQLLFVSKDSGSGLDTVSELYGEAGNDIDATAKKLEVAKAEYSPERVKAAISEATSTAQAAATETATQGVNDAIGSALGGWNR